jgi:hypothetical protein
MCPVDPDDLEPTVTVELIAADAVAILILVFGLFVPRHRRHDLVVAYLTVNVGVLAVSTTLASTTISMGVGLGLFGVLSIIRLRSEELAQHEIAYYFAALALGLLGGTAAVSVPLGIGLMAAILFTLFVGDHPRIAQETQRQNLVLDSAYTDPQELRARVQQVVTGRVRSITVIKTDLVNDTTTVDVRFTPVADRAALPVLEGSAR